MRVATKSTAVVKKEGRKGPSRKKGYGGKRIIRNWTQRTGRKEWGRGIIESTVIESLSLERWESGTENERKR